jgi:GAF domain-containing protein
VVPIHRDGQVVAVLDIDSPSLSRFDEADKEGLEEFVRALEEVVEF